MESKPPKLKNENLSNKKVTLTLEQKLNILTEIEGSQVHNFAETGRKHGVSRSAISKLWKNREELKKEGNENENTDRKRKRTFKEEAAEKALKIWVDQKNEQHARVNAPMLKQKAKQLAETLGREFEPSDGWISRFKKRNGLVYKKEHGEKQSTDFKAADDYTKQKLPELLKEYSADDIYNADETALFFKCIPDRGYAGKKVELSGGKKQKDRLTVLVCTNMSGSDRKKLLVIGKSKSPRGFPHDQTRLPVIYRHSSNAWMTSQIFTEYLRTWDRALRLQGRSVLLLVDNCSAHPKVDGLVAIRLEFLPPNTTATLQPCDQGIIRNLKVYYRAALNNMVIAELDADERRTAPEIASRITVLKAIYYLHDAWFDVKPQTIANCFRKAGFVKDETATDAEQAHEVPEEEFSMPDNMTAEEFDNFVDMDENEPVTGELNDEEILKTVIAEKSSLVTSSSSFSGKSEKEEESGAEDDDVEELKMPPPAVLMESLNNMSVFMQLTGLTSQSPFSSLTKAIQTHVTAGKVQPTISSFFKKA